MNHQGCAAADGVVRIAVTQMANVVKRVTTERGLDARDVVIPDEAEMQRARDIRDELYRRSGDRARPRYERDYIDRLLERF